MIRKTLEGIKIKTISSMYIGSYLRLYFSDLSPFSFRNQGHSSKRKLYYHI